MDGVVVGSSGVTLVAAAGAAVAVVSGGHGVAVAFAGLVAGNDSVCSPLHPAARISAATSSAALVPCRILRL
jgi:hypothetical protein